MPLRTGKLEEKSDAVRYAVKQYRKKAVDKVNAKDKQKDVAKHGISESKTNDVEIVKIDKKPVKGFLEKVKKYFR